MQIELERFGQPNSIEEQAEALSDLMKAKEHHKAAKDPRFDHGVQFALRIAGGQGTSDQRLVAVATLLRIAGLIKSQQANVAASLTEILAEPLPPLWSATKPDDRYYVATLWRHATKPWVSSYLANGLVDEEGSERVRPECAEGLVGLCPDLASVVEMLRIPLRRLDFQTEKRGDSKGKRVRRVLGSIRTAYSSALKEPGADVGDRLRVLLAECFQQTGIPTTEAVLDDVSEEALGLIHSVVQARFSTATSPNTYAGVEVVRGWYRETTWRYFAEKSSSARLLARDLSEAIEMLVRAGIADDVLYARLAVVTGGEDTARQQMRQILDRVSGLPDDLARWLSGLPIRRKSALASENQLLSFDETLADLMIDCARMQEMLEVVQRDVMPELSVMAPRSGPSLDSLIGLIRSTLNSVQAMTRLRSLALTGNVGETTEFSPLEHEMLVGAPPGVRKIRIVKPGVDAPSEAGGRRIVRKAIVEPAS
jgi:hypothetical protein